MKKTIDEKLNDILDVDVTTGKIVAPKSNKIQDIAVEDDYEYARNNLRGLIENGKEVMQNIIFVAKESESPRSYEVVGQLIKTLADTNKDLLELAKKSKELKQSSNENVGETNITNALFVGSTAELQKLLKK
jgi:predicted house-cleaning noncanonical NTP pyrophosphatase (MazG superfamily)